MKKAAALALLALAASAQAAELSPAFQCDRSPHDFVGTLINQRLIDARPHVDQRSLNTFRPLPGSHLTVFQYKVISVVGYQPDDSVFGEMPGASIPALYGVVVFGAPADVQASLNSAGYTRARIAHAGPHLTAIACRVD
ncbi:hypothetical protein C0Z20_00845 [Trinickia symbiotica]|uniref:Uncharacterized protein n=2 Tax=Trinickia symbiotica TaxID=863227 RepID=A0A2N7XAI1_9BURK|nr:hypothetical protein C0Z20_00845 [Trinickia symbiotica]